MASINEIRRSIGVRPISGLDEPLSSKEETRQTFGERVSGVLAGDRPVFNGEGGSWMRRAARTVGNVVTGMFREPARAISSAAMQAVDVLPGGGPTLIQQQEQYGLTQRAMAEMDTRLAKRIKSLDPKKPDDRKMLDHLRDFMASRGSIDEPFVPRELDVSGLRQGLGFVETAALVTMMTTPGVNALSPFKKSYQSVVKKIYGTAILKPAWGTVKLGELAITGLGYGVENALYGALATYTAPRPKGEKVPLNEVLKNAGIGGLIGGPLGLGFLGAGAALSRGNVLHETFRDLASFATARAVRGVDAPVGYSRATTVNTKGIKPKEIVETPRPGDVAADDFSKVFLGDIITTREGAVGRVVGSINKPAATEISENIQSLLQRVATNEQLIADARRAGVAPDLIKLMEQSRRDLNARVDTALEKIGETGEGGFDARVSSIQLELIDSSGKPRTVSVPYESVLEGGIIRGREVLTPGTSSSVGARATANEIAHAQLSQRRSSINIADQSLPIPSTKGMTDDEIRQMLLSREHLVLADDFEPKRATAANLMMKEETTQRTSGINPRPGQLAEARMDRDQSDIFTALKNLTRAAFEENGIVYPEGFVATAKATIGSRNFRKQVGALSERLFDASEGRTPLHELKPAERSLVVKWQEIAKDLLQRVNDVLVASGKKPIKGIEKYITNIVTPQAMAIYQLSGAFPPGLLSELTGGRAAALFKGKTPKQIIDTLLLPRYGGLPIEKDFFRAVNRAVLTHTKFIHMQPVLREYNLVLEHWNKLFPNTFKKYGTNVAIVQNFLKKLSGNDITHEFLRAVDQTIIETLTAEKWLGVKNPFRGAFIETINTNAFGLVQVPSSGLINRVNQFGVNKGYLSPKAIKHAFYVNTLSFSSQYPVLNLTQYPLLAVPRLRGPLVQRYKTAFRSWSNVIKHLNDPIFIEKMRKAGVLNESQRFTEFEAGMGTDSLGVKGGAWEKVTMWTSKTSEFVNRSATFEAIYDNILTTTSYGSGGKAFNKYWDEVNKLSKGEVYKKATELAEELSGIVNFKSGITHRAPISDNPVGALWDQFNTYFRGFVSSHKAMYRNMKENDPEFVELWRNAWNKGEVAKFGEGLIKRLKDENLDATKKGELIRFHTGATLFLVPLSLAGLSAGKGAVDFFGGGLSRFSDGILDVMQGIVNGDDEKIDQGMMSIMLPPSIPPVMTAAKDAYQYAFGGETVTWQKLVMAPYSPFKKPVAETFPALKAIAVGTAQPVIDPKTGRIKYVIEPQDAVNKILFGYRSKTDSERNKEIDMLSALQAKGTKQSKERQRKANEIIDELESRDYAGRRKYWDSLIFDGTIDPEDTEMAGIIADEWYHRKLLQSGTIERTLRTLPSEQKAEFLKKVTSGMDRPDRDAYYSRQYTEGNVSSDVVKELLK